MKKATLKIKTLAAILSLSTATFANADIGKAMDSMLGIDNSQTTQAWASKNGVNGSYSASLGGYSTRSPVRKISVFSFTAPDFKAGCAGIDFQFGSFSLIGRSEIEELLKKIMANARGYAVKLAIDKICPSCLAVARQLEEQATAWNANLKNTCEISETALNWLADGVENAVKHKEKTNAISSAGEEDAAAVAAKDKNRGNRGTGENTPQKNAQYANSLLNTMISAQVFSKKDIDTEAYGGDRQFFEMAMSMLGTHIFKATDKDTGTQSTEQDEHINAIWGFDDFTHGTKSNHQQYILKCKDFDINDVEACQKVHHAENQWKGTYRYILEIILGDQDDDDFKNGMLKIQDDSVITYLREKYNEALMKNNPNANIPNQNTATKKISERRQAFVDNTSVLDNTALSILDGVVAQDNPVITVAIAEAIAQAGAEQLSAEMVAALVQTVHVAYNTNLQNGKKRAILSPTQFKNLNELKKRAEMALNDKHETFAKVDKLYQAMTNKLPKPIDYLNNPNIDLSNYR